MIAHYIKLSLSITVISWVVGIIFSTIFKNAKFYNKLSSMNFVASKTFNKVIGITLFKWIVKSTPFKYLNQNLKIANPVEITDLEELRREMTLAEINHLVGFFFVIPFACIELVKGNYLFALFYMIANVLLNLYPSLLQQENKRRIDRLIRIFG